MLMLTNRTARIFARKPRGFSLMEMAIVLMIMGILMSGVLVSVSQTTLNARRASALAQMRGIEEALYGFAQKEGRLPCPAEADGTGTEEPLGGGNCTLIHGFVPAATLGFDGPTNDDGLLLDPWQNPYRYSLASDSAPDFSDDATINTFFSSATPITTAEMMQVCDTGDCMGTVMTNIAPAVILTMGENWETTSVTEEANANDTSPLVGTVTGNSYLINDDLDFLSTGYIEDEFDDQLVWLSPYVLFNRMVSAGKLP